jgi:hypothetical protein
MEKRVGTTGVSGKDSFSRGDEGKEKHEKRPVHHFQLKYIFLENELSTAKYL